MRLDSHQHFYFYTHFKLLTVLACLVFAGGCSSQGSNSSGAEGTRTRPYRIAVIPKGTSHDFWYSVRAGAEKAASELDNVEVTWKGPLGEGDTADQISIVEDFIANGYDGICLAPLDATALRQPVTQATQWNVPVLIFDSGLKAPQGIVSFVATNNYRGGQRAGQHLAELLEGRGRVILMRYDLNSQSTEEREQGFLDALAGYPEITFLEKDKFAGPDERHAIELGENLLQNHGDQVDGIFCPNQSTASGMLTVLQRDPRGLAGKVKLVGFDSGTNIAEGLKSGDMHGTVLQDPVKMGYEAVMTMYRYLQGEEVPEQIEIEEALAAPENLDDPHIQKLLYPAAAK